MAGTTPINLSKVIARHQKQTEKLLLRELMKSAQCTKKLLC